ncbi:YciI family protein [Ruania rhizosphaerae]|uniref:YciI family protein n=1 Tax=Ruania rhizosphaerae TaxID=1840413 RepID=UPI001356BF09|nr:YciI family protein [Ruania rhizosphaerae]
MSTYVVLLTGDETVWEKVDAEQQASVFAKHEEFARLLAARGHQLAGGEELKPSQGTKKITPGADGKLTVTDGPYAETVEQLGGFYLVESDDLEDLIEICGVLAESHGAIEVRAAVDHSGNGG